MKYNALRSYLKEVDAIEDDYDFISAEYDAVQTYCEEHDFKLNEDDLKELKSRGLIDSFENWKEQREENYE